MTFRQLTRNVDKLNKGQEYILELVDNRGGSSFLPTIVRGVYSGNSSFTNFAIFENLEDAANNENAKETGDEYNLSRENKKIDEAYVKTNSGGRRKKRTKRRKSHRRHKRSRTYRRY
jgi:hypothetical protein